jgi:hypothetical protein
VYPADVVGELRQFPQDAEILSRPCIDLRRTLLAGVFVRHRCL